MQQIYDSAFVIFGFVPLAGSVDVDLFCFLEVVETDSLAVNGIELYAACVFW